MTETTIRLEDLRNGRCPKLEAKDESKENKKTETLRRIRRMNIALCVIQALLALLFVFSGVTKLMMPAHELATQTHLPGLFIKFVALCEVLGGLGLVLPGLLRIKTGLTPLAAGCLVIVMIGATVVTILTVGAAFVILPVVTGLLAAFVMYGRTKLAPLGK